MPPVRSRPGNSSNRALRAISHCHGSCRARPADRRLDVRVSMSENFTYLHGIRMKFIDRGRHQQGNRVQGSFGIVPNSRTTLGNGFESLSRPGRPKRFRNIVYRIASPHRRRNRQGCLDSTQNKSLRPKPARSASGYLTPRSDGQPGNVGEIQYTFDLAQYRAPGTEIAHAPAWCWAALRIGIPPPK